MVRFVTKDEAREGIARLVHTYTHLSEEKRRHYHDEANVEKDFIRPLFRELGWDVETSEVTAQERVRTKKADYAFKINSRTRFFVEAKSFRENLDDSDHLKQAISYAYMKGVTWTVLTNFRRLKILNAEWLVPNPASAIYPFELEAEKYADQHFETLWLLSAPATLADELSIRAVSVGKKSKPKDISKVLFEHLSEWRDTLFGELYGWYQDKRLDYSPATLDDAIQSLFNRIVFLRTVEDRGIEDPHLREYLNQINEGVLPRSDLLPKLLELFRDMNGVYNASLFAPDTSALESILRDKKQRPDVSIGTMIDFINGLYDIPGTYTRYDFSGIDADILGTMYEQFLEDSKRVRSEETSVRLKRRTRKEQGSFYTPTFIVKYIVQQTLGRLLDSPDMTLEKAHHLRILDPACGSGAFLIAAFDLLDDYFKVHEPQLPQHQRQYQIVTENLYGVDIDHQAVEVARLNLFLRVANERGRLPETLNKHIAQGNSLVSDKGVDPDTALDWDKAFKTDGFDVVIGNPPYIRIQTLAREQVTWFSSRYETATGNYDIYVLFVEQAIKLLRKKGVTGFILPSKFFSTDYGIGLRKFLAENRIVTQIVDFGHAQVFEGATTYTTLLFSQETPVESTIYRFAQDWLLSQEQSPLIVKEEELPTSKVILPVGKSWTFASDKTETILEKLQGLSVQLLDFPAQIARGSSTGADDIYVLKLNGNILTTQDDEIVSLEEAALRIPVHATDFGRYSFRSPSNKRIIFPYSVNSDSYRLLSENEFGQRFPKAYSYLNSRKFILEKRKQWNSWYGYSAPRNLDAHDNADLLVPLLANQGLYCKLPVDATPYCLMASGGFSISVSNPHYNPVYILGLLNSKLLFWNLSIISNVFRGGWITCTKQYTGQLPIRLINFEDTADKARHDRMVALVETMLSLKREQAALADWEGEKREHLETEFQEVDNQIDALVYELYGLTDDEIAVVEGR